MTGSSRQESQAQKPLHKILTLYAGKRLYEVLVPFVCQCCARCCRQLGVDLSSLDNRRIADYFGLEWEEVSARYLSKVDSSKDTSSYDWLKRWAPCPFLSPGGECLIYPVRPSGCWSYPVYTLLGPESVDCPGMELMQKIVSVLGRGIPYEFHFPGGERAGRPSPTRVRRMIEKLEKAKLPQEIIDELIRLNRWGPFLKKVNQDALVAGGEDNRPPSAQ